MNAKTLHPGNDRPGSVHFGGTWSAEVYTRAIAESLREVLVQNLVGPQGPEHAGFLFATVGGRPWSDTMWSRDTGVFLRELVAFGYWGHARLIFDQLMDLVEKNEEGYYWFPERFLPGEHKSGTEVDGTCAVCHAMVSLWSRLPGDEPYRDTLYRFLNGGDGPLAYMLHLLKKEPLIKGSGEFGGGCSIPGLHYNVVINAQSRCLLLACAQMADSAEDEPLAAKYREAAATLAENMLKHLIADNGSWIWCITPGTLEPDPEILNHFYNKGFGGINGVLTYQADHSGFDPRSGDWVDVDTSIRTFDALAAVPMRKEQFEKYGMWTQFDDPPLDRYSGPSYGHGYALQTMLLLDRMEWASHAMDYLAEATVRPPRGYKLDRESSYWFYERYLSPDMPDPESWDQGVGALNVVCVAEPLKIARMVAGLDDVNPAVTALRPRLPETWGYAQLTDWPVRTTAGVSRVDFELVRRDAGWDIHLVVVDGPALPALLVRGLDPAESEQFEEVDSVDIRVE